MRINLNKLRNLIIEAILNAYDVLGVPHNASEDDIKKAWRKMAIQNHPDRGGSHGKMVDINAAKDRLLDKTALFRYGPNFKGYEQAGAPKTAAPPPPPPPPPPGPSASSNSRGWGHESTPMRDCPVCGRKVALKDGSFVNHYQWTPTPSDLPPPKCPNSGKPSAAGSSSSAGSSYSRGPSGSPGGAAPGQQQRPGGAASGASTSNASVYKYMTFIAGNSRKFWEVEVVGDTLYVRFGRIGTRGQLRTKKYASSIQARRSASRMIYTKTNKGYVEGTAPPGARPSAAAASGAAPGAATGAAGGAAAGGAAPSGRPSKDSYKVYGWRQGRRVVRVGGKLYGTEPGGTLRGGGNTRFNANDRANVRPDGSRMKVTNPSNNHTQTWDPIDEMDEVRKVVDELVMEMIEHIASE